MHKQSAAVSSLISRIVGTVVAAQVRGRHRDQTVSDTVVHARVRPILRNTLSDMLETETETIAMSFLALHDPSSVNHEHAIPDIDFSPDSNDGASTLARPLTPPSSHPDPILQEMATKQPAAMFKAKPMPKSTTVQNVGPKLSKAAALRMGVTITPNKGGVQEGRGTPTTKDEETPGYKRTGLKLNVKSLASPSVAPRQTKASMIRCGQVPPSVSSPRPVASIQGCTRLQHEDSQKGVHAENRRKSYAPPSLAAPSIEPRATRSSALRSGGASNVPAADVSKRSYHDMTPEEKAERNRRMFVGVPGHRQAGSLSVLPRSLANPEMVPRLNRAAMLRTAPGATSVSSTTKQATRPLVAVEADLGAASTHKSAKSPGSSAGRSVHVRRQSIPAVAPRPTKASLLRLQNGGKV